MLLSGIIIAKNEEERIVRCIRSLTFCDEIIVVDGGSEDKTCKIAENLGAKVYTFITSSFSEARESGLKKAKGKWVLYVDADEEVTQDLAANIKESTTKQDTIYSAYFIQRKNFYLGNNPWPHVEKLERLFQREKLRGWYGKLHESPKIEGKVGVLSGYLLHYSHRSLSEMVKKTLLWSTIEAEERFKNNHPQMKWWRFPRVMLSAFYNSYIRQKGWKAGTAGIIESVYQAFSVFVTYAKLWELQKNKENHNE